MLLPLSGAFSRNDSVPTVKEWFAEGWHKFPAQKDDGLQYRLYGFLRTDLAVQSRAMKTSVQGLFPAYPLPASYNENGTDLNRSASVGLYSITSRLGLRFQTKGILGAERTSACVEADFTGSSDNVLLVLRKAFVQLDWTHADLLVGQTWHPLYTEAAPVPTLAITVGSPYNSFNRSPQIRYVYHLTERSAERQIDLTGAVLGQTNYKSVGPDPADATQQISSLDFQRNALIPNVFLGASYARGGWLAGLGVDYKAIKPVSTFTNYAGVEMKNNRLLHSVSGMVYGAYRKDMFYVTAKAIVGSNLCDHLMLGGYSVGQRLVKIDGVSGYVLDFAPFTALSSYVDVSYGKRFRINFFGGYSANFGSVKTLNKTYTYYGTGISGSQTIKDMFRCELGLTYNPGRWTFGLEVQYDNAAWGSVTEAGKIQLPEGNARVGSLWADASVIFNF